MNRFTFASKSQRSRSISKNICMLLFLLFVTTSCENIRGKDKMQDFIA